MAEKVNLAPKDKYADDPEAAARADRETSDKLKSGLVGSFPASDPPSITQPAPTKPDAQQHKPHAIWQRLKSMFR